MTKIQLSRLQTWSDRLSAVYEVHDLDYTYVIQDTQRPTSLDITNLYNAFQDAYEEVHLANAVKWTIGNSELERGSLIREIIANSIDASLISMEAQTHYSQIINSGAGATYTRATYTNGTSYSRTTNTATNICSPVTNYGNMVGYHEVIYHAGVEGSYTAGWTYGQTAYSTTGTTYGETSHLAGTTYSESSHTNATTYSRTIHSATTTYTETK